jgi:ribosomal protein S18 acetylase RimI-like enzyme
MNMRVRQYQDESDYWKIREFLRQTFLKNNRRELSWQASRFDYYRWHVVENISRRKLEKDVHVWEDGEGQIAAVLNPEGPGYAYMQVDPEYKSRELEQEMLDVAEEKLVVSKGEERLKLNVFAGKTDMLRQDILRQRGYELSNTREHHHSCLISNTLPEVILPEDYKVRALGDIEELPARSFLSWKAFHPQEPVEDYEGWEWYLNIQRAPLYRRDLDLVVTSPGGELCSFCTVWFDDVTRVGSFEPVGTAPEYQRLGLGKAVMYEGLHRLQRMGAEMAFVGSGSEGAYAFYTSIGFDRLDISEMWTKSF